MCNLENVFSQLTNMIYSLYVYKENVSESYKEIHYYIILATVAHFNRQAKSCVNLIKVMLHCLKFTLELGLMKNIRLYIASIHKKIN